MTGVKYRFVIHADAYFPEIIVLSPSLHTRYFFFIRTSKFLPSLGLFLVFPIHLLKILAKSQPGCSYKVCSYKEKNVYANTIIFFNLGK